MSRPSPGTRSTAPIGSPLTSRMRLSPVTHVGEVALSHHGAPRRRPSTVRGSRTGSGRHSLTWKMPSPPLPSRGFRIISPPSVDHEVEQVLHSVAAHPCVGHQLGETAGVELLVRAVRMASGRLSTTAVRHSPKIWVAVTIGGVDRRILALEHDVGLGVEIDRPRAARDRQWLPRSHGAGSRHVPGPQARPPLIRPRSSGSMATLMPMSRVFWASSIKHEGGIRPDVDRLRQDPSRTRVVRGPRQPFS